MCIRDSNSTIRSCFIGYIVQAIVNNFVPLLFITFQSQYSIPLSKITLLITINFGLQLIDVYKRQGQLFTDDCYDEIAKNWNKQSVVKALCIHVAHDCNLRCKYCFADTGEFHGGRSLMSAEVGKKAIDFVINNSGNRKNIEIDYFGGEPLMNFGVVKEITEYALSLIHI